MCRRGACGSWDCSFARGSARSGLTTPARVSDSTCARSLSISTAASARSPPTRQPCAGRRQPAGDRECRLRWRIAQRVHIGTRRPTSSTYAGDPTAAQSRLPPCLAPAPCRHPRSISSRSRTASSTMHVRADERPMPDWRLPPDTSSQRCVASASVGHADRIRPSLLARAENDDTREAENFHF